MTFGVQRSACHGTNKSGTLFSLERRAQHAARSTASGFTLIEMVVVIVILSVVALVVMPRLPFARDLALRTTARSLASTIRYLDDRSTTAKEAYRLRFDLNESSLSVTMRSPGGDYLPPGDPFLARRILGEGITIEDVLTSRLGKISEGEVTMNFNAGGIEDFIAIHLKGGDERKTVMALPNGKVKILDGYQEALP